MISSTSGNKNSRGFNLLELMIVVTIIGLLVAVALIAQTEARNKAYNKAVVQQVNEMVSALEIYFTDARMYPTGASSPGAFPSEHAQIYCIGEGKVSGCIPGAIIISNSHIEQVLMPKYLARIPHTQAGPYSSLAYQRCTNPNPSDTSALTSSCREDDFSIWYVLKGSNSDCGRGQQAVVTGMTIEPDYTLCRMQATK
jgi:prepilin-type N-terminal cleavage/methylation domain-containing protein